MNQKGKSKGGGWEKGMNALKVEEEQYLIGPLSLSFLYRDFQNLAKLNKEQGNQLVFHVYKVINSR